MSDYGVFESINGSEGERKIASRDTQRKLDAAIDDVKRQYGAFLFASRDGEEWNDRVALCKNDMLKTIDAHIVPVTGVVRRIVKACKDEWRFKVADKTGPAMDNDVTFAPKKDKDLKPKGDFDAYLNKVDQNSDEVDNCFKEGYRYAENDMAGGGGYGAEMAAMPSELGMGGPIADPSGQAPNVSPMSIPGIQAARYFNAADDDNFFDWLGQNTRSPFERRDDNGADRFGPDDGFDFRNPFVNDDAPTGGGEESSTSGDDEEATPSLGDTLGDTVGQAGVFNSEVTNPSGVPGTAPGPAAPGPAAAAPAATGAPAAAEVSKSSGGGGGNNSGGGSAPASRPMTSGDVADGGVAGAENGNNEAIKGKSYTVQQGDTLTDIAQRGFGDMNMYDDLAKSNNISNPDVLTPGQVINSGDAEFSGNNGVRGDVTNPAGGGSDGNLATPNAGPAAAPAPAPAAPAPQPTKVGSLALGQYIDWCDSFGARRASVKNLDIYAQKLNDQAYFEIASALTDPSSPIYRSAAGGNSGAPQSMGNSAPQSGPTGGATGGGAPEIGGVNWNVITNPYESQPEAIEPSNPYQGLTIPENYGGGNAGATAHFGAYLKLCRQANMQPTNQGFRQFVAANAELIQVDPDLAKMRMDQRAQQGGRSLPMDGMGGPGKSKGEYEGGTSIDPDMLKALMAQSQNIVTGARMRTAAPDYLQKADEALTNLLNQKAEEFQQTIAPLQQALQTVQQAEAAQQAMSPMGVQPPAGTVNVLPPAPGADAGGGDPMAGGGGMDPSMMGMDPSMMGGDPSGGMGGDPAAMGGGAPPMDPSQMQMQARRKRVNRGKAQGANAPRRAGIVNDVDEWGKGRGVTTGNPEVDLAQFESETGTTIGPKQRNKLTKPKPVSTANPMPKSKQPITTKMPKSASFFTRKVAGWQWDDHLNGYLASNNTPFTCKCGSKHPVPSYSTCKCGKIYNSYVIGTGGDNHQASVEKFICREIPVRDNVIVANRRRKTAMPWVGGLNVTDGAPAQDKPIMLAYGGAFNPPHEGHVGALQDAQNALRGAGYNVAGTFVVPTADRLLAGKEMDPAHRLNLQSRANVARAAFPKDIDGAPVTVHTGPSEEIETAMTKPRRTDLANWIQQRYPNHTVVNVTGEDALVPGAPDQHPSIYSGAPGSNHEGFAYLTMPRDPDESMSSSKIRAALASGQPLPGMTPDSERAYRDELGKLGAGLGHTARRKASCDCWEGYERVPGTKPCAEGSCRKCDSNRKKESGKVKRHNLTDPGPLSGGKDDKMPSINEELGEDWYKRGPGGKYARKIRRSR